MYQIYEQGGVSHFQKIKVCTLEDDSANNTDHVDIRFLSKLSFKAFYAPITSKE